MSSREIEAKQDEEFAAALGQALGLSSEELDQTDWEISSEVSADGGITYAYIVHFGEAADPEILKKIPGLGDGRTIRLSPNKFDQPDFDPEEHQS